MNTLIQTLQLAPCTTADPSPACMPTSDGPGALANMRTEKSRLSCSLDVRWASHLDEIREAQRLRHEVFAAEMGAHLPQTLPGHDVDLFDDYCEHLIVRDLDTARVVGTYRLLTPAQARRVGGFYADTEFDLTRLRHLRDQMVELGRSCVHADYRQGAVIMALWGGLSDFMQRNRLDTMVGCASIPMNHRPGSAPGVGARAAASIWRKVSQAHLASIEFHVRPRLPLPVDWMDGDVAVEAPPLIKAYLRLGAKVLGPPAWDPEFNTADLPLMLRLQDMGARYRRHFLRAG